MTEFVTALASIGWPGAFVVVGIAAAVAVVLRELFK